eukprot:TRINITY_DN6591_c0_g1_i1.p1 TRINITY_DN6591_c0_g1~~TRINITY_DN6591_c0_g1_i1.p1  ORF type:complete len:605 (+),score=125.62 TRINITY_DN6591_c0_g1_i1:65-1816(+)
MNAAVRCGRVRGTIPHASITSTTWASMRRAPCSSSSPLSQHLITRSHHSPSLRVPLQQVPKHTRRLGTTSRLTPSPSSSTTHRTSSMLTASARHNRVFVPFSPAALPQSLFSSSSLQSYPPRLSSSPSSAQDSANSSAVDDENDDESLEDCEDDAELVRGTGRTMTITCGDRFLAPIDPKLYGEASPAASSQSSPSLPHASSNLTADDNIIVSGQARLFACRPHPNTDAIVLAHTLEVTGDCEIFGDVVCTTLRSRGSLKIHGSVTATTIDSGGRFHAKKSVRSVTARFAGRTDVGGDILAATELVIDGSVVAGGRLVSSSVHATLSPVSCDYGHDMQSAVTEIDGTDIHIGARDVDGVVRDREVGDAGTGGENETRPALLVNRVVALKRLHLERTQAVYVSGTDCELSDGTTAKRVVYTDSYKDDNTTDITNVHQIEDEADNVKEERRRRRLGHTPHPFYWPRKLYRPLIGIHKPGRPSLDADANGEDESNLWIKAKKEDHYPNSAKLTQHEDEQLAVLLRTGIVGLKELARELGTSTSGSKRMLIGRVWKKMMHLQKEVALSQSFDDYDVTEEDKKDQQYW